MWNAPFFTVIGDFRVGDVLFEVGGRSKKWQQLKPAKNAYIIADDIVVGHEANIIPLYLFGFLVAK